MRSLRAPPDVVRDVLEGVLRLMGIADTSWHSMKNFLSKRGVKEDIRLVAERHGLADRFGFRCGMIDFENTEV